MAEAADCVVVGAGLAGLTCALRLARGGTAVTVVDAGVVGGRTRSRHVDGRPVDRGFQVLFSAYPATRRLLGDIGIAGAGLRRFSRNVAVFDGSATRLVTADPRSLMRLPGVTVGDVLRLGRLVGEAATLPVEALLDSPLVNQSTEDYLRGRGLSAGAVDAIVRPLFGVVFLDRSLQTDAGYFRYLCHMMARGPVVLPAEGLGEIARRAASAVVAAGGEVLTGDGVEGLERDSSTGRVSGVRLSGGRRMKAACVVLAVEAGAARSLLYPVDGETAARVPKLPASVRTAAYLLDRPLYRGRTIILNAEAKPGHGRVDLLCQTSNVTTPGSPAPHVLLATRVTTGADEGSGDDLPDAVEHLVGRLSPAYPWRASARLVEVVDHRGAQWRPLPGMRTQLPGPRTGVPNLLLAGDLTTHPSIEGAVVSGERAAAAVRDALVGS